MNNNQSKAVIVVRVSTLPQAIQGTSLESQETACREVLSIKGIGLHKVYTEDGKSGALYATRKGMQDALTDIEEGRANVLCTHKLDRAGRDVENLLDIKKRVQRAQARFIFDGNEIENSPDGDMMFLMLAGMSERERNIIAQRTKRGRLAKAQTYKQQPCRTVSPYGYHVVNKEDLIRATYPASLIGTYQIVPEWAEWVIQMFSKYAVGMSMRQIKKWLKEMGVLSPEGKAEWSVTTIRRILTGSVYKGKPVFRRTRRVVDEERVTSGRFQREDYSVVRPEEEWIQLECDPLVSEEVWDECQRRLTENKAKRSGNPKRRYLLGGMVVCPKCERIVAGSATKNGQYRYYTCPHDRGCKWRINVDVTERFVQQGVMNAAQLPDLLATAERAYQARLKSDYDAPTVQRFTNDLAALEEKESALVDSEAEARKKGRSTAVYERKLDVLNAERIELETRIAVMETRKEQVQDAANLTNMAETVFASMATALTSTHLTAIEKNEILSAVVTAVKPNVEGTEIILILRPFYTGEGFFVLGKSLIVPQILIRVLTQAS